MIENCLIEIFFREHVDFARFVDISQLSENQNKGYKKAILFGVSLSPSYVFKVLNETNYIERTKKENLICKDEFNIKEIKVNSLADTISDYLSSIGYSSYSQSEKNILNTGCFDHENKETPLPHKTLAILSGLGWIGKSNLLVTPEYGSAISMCSVLTNAPLDVFNYNHITSKCGDCNVCMTVCNVNAIKGNLWSRGVSRENIIDVSLCKTCLKCMMFCPWTEAYIKRVF